MRAWHHGPEHRLGETGAYMVTAGTYGKVHFFGTPERLTMLHDLLLELAGRYEWLLQAWAVFPNHYHFVALAPAKATMLTDFTRHLHSESARKINALDHASGRKV